MPKRKKYKISKKKMKRFAILVFLIIMIIIVFNIVKVKNIIEDKNNQTSKAELSTEEMSFENVLKKYEVQINSKELLEDRSIYLKVNFKYNLYENGKGQKDYFIALIEELNLYASNNYTLNDKSKNIEIIAKKNLDTGNWEYTINGQQNYFDNESIEILNSKKVIEEKDFAIEKPTIKTLEILNWNILDARTFKPQGNGIYSNDENLKVEAFNSKITRVIADREYKGKILENIKVGTEFKKIEEKLGEPNFINKELNMIGYKLTDTYVFFYEDEIIMYPNIDYDNEEFEDLIFSYYNGDLKIERARFANKVLTEYKDFNSYLEEDALTLKSVTRQIEIRISNDEKMEIKPYNNYNLSEKMINNVAQGNIILDVLDEDYVYKTEVENRKKN